MMEDRVEVTRENFGELLIQGLHEALAFERGELAKVRVDRLTLTARQAEVAPPPRYSPERIAEIRQRLRASQLVFAGLLNVSASTVRAWERGARSPEGPTLRLLEIADKHPEVLAGAVTAREQVPA